MQPLIINRFDKAFGPAGASAGISLMLGGIVATIFSPYGILLLLAGAFLAFTYSSVAIDVDEKRVRGINNFFGILKFGKWMDINPEMYITVKPNKLSYRTYSRSNRSVDIKTHNYKIVLCNETHKEIMPLKNTKTLAEAKKYAEELALQLIISTQFQFA